MPAVFELPRICRDVPPLRHGQLVYLRADWSGRLRAHATPNDPRTAGVRHPHPLTTETAHVTIKPGIHVACVIESAAIARGLPFEGRVWFDSPSRESRRDCCTFHFKFCLTSSRSRAPSILALILIPYHIARDHVSPSPKHRSSHPLQQRTPTQRIRIYAWVLRLISTNRATSLRSPAVSFASVPACRPVQAPHRRTTST
jgi:hypothetical protein